MSQPSASQILAVLDDHIVAVRGGGPNEANFVVACSCGQKIGVASLGRASAEQAGRRHVAETILDLYAPADLGLDKP